MHHVTQTVADQDDIAIAVDQRRGMSMIRGQHHDWIAVLASANVGCCPATMVDWIDISGSEDGNADNVRMEESAECKIKDDADDNRDHVVANPADWNL